jgi:hypothetical protein
MALHPKNSTKRDYGLRRWPPFFGIADHNLERYNFRKMPDQTPASSDNPRPARSWRYANYRGVGWVALIAIAGEAISQLVSSPIKSFMAGASVGLLMLLLEMIMARRVEHSVFAVFIIFFIALSVAKDITGIKGSLATLQCGFAWIATATIGILIFRKPLLSRYRKILEAADASRALA